MTRDSAAPGTGTGTDYLTFYSGRYVAEADCARLATIARLMGLQPQPVDQCRVLELGCGDAGHLLALARTFPGSEFHGVDIVAENIEKGRTAAQALGLSNVRLEVADLDDFSTATGSVDYLIAHGVYSWVPKDTKGRLMQLCGELLADAGVAYVSYNAYPGFHVREMIREMLLYHASTDADVPERLAEAREFLDVLLEAPIGREKSLRYVHDVIAGMRNASEYRLAYDELARFNTAVYFSDFVAEARSVGLQFLGESVFQAMNAERFDGRAGLLLREFGTDRLQREQYLDFFAMRHFRRTLLCRAAVKLSPSPDASAIREFWIESKLTPSRGASCDLRAGVSERFETAQGVKIDVAVPFAKAALLCLAERHGHPLHFEELLLLTRDQLGTARAARVDAAADANSLCKGLLDLYAEGLVVLDVHARRPDPGV